MGGLTRAAHVPHGRSSNCPADILPHPRHKRCTGCGSQSAGNSTANIPNATAGFHGNPSQRGRKEPVIPCRSKVSAWPNLPLSAALLSAAWLVTSALIVAPSQRRAITDRQFEEFGRQFKGAMRAAIGDGKPSISSPTQSAGKHASLVLRAYSLASRSIPEKLSATWSAVCQTHNAVRHGAFHLAIIASALAEKAYSILGGITHRI